MVELNHVLIIGICTRSFLSHEIGPDEKVSFLNILHLLRDRLMTTVL